VQNTAAYAPYVYRRTWDAMDWYKRLWPRARMIALIGARSGTRNCKFTKLQPFSTRLAKLRAIRFLGMFNESKCWMRCYTD